MGKRLISMFLALILLLAGIPEMGILAKAAESGSANLLKLVVNEVPLVQQEFDPEQTEYTGTAYMSVKNLNVWAVPSNPGAVVNINGKAVDSSNVSKDNNYGRQVVEFDQKKQADITIQVSNGDQEKTYHILIQKVDTDYRGRSLIEVKGVSASSEQTGFEAEKAIDKNEAAGWKPNASNAQEVVGQHIDFDLGQNYVVSRMTALLNTPEGWGENSIWNNMVGVQVREDESDEWITAFDKGNLRNRTPRQVTDPSRQFHRYEFGDNYTARYIRFSYEKYEMKLIPEIKEVMVYGYEPGDPSIPEPSKDEINQECFVPSNPNITRGQDILMNKGFQYTSWVASGDYGRGTYDAKEYEGSELTGLIFYDPPLENTEFFKYTPNAQWGIAKAPWGGNAMSGAGEPKDYLPEEMRPYVANFVSSCFGDEGLYSLSEVNLFKKWFDWSKDNYPGVILHSNQALGRGWENNNAEPMHVFTEIAQPDLLTHDNYYYNGTEWDNEAGSTRNVIMSSSWQREAALAGLTGDGTMPILFGQYVSAFNRDLTESQKYMINNVSLAMGMKWLDLWRTEFAFDECFLFDYDGTPKRSYYEWADIIRQTKNMGDALIRLNSDTLVTKTGLNSNGNPNTAASRQASDVVGGMGSFEDNAAKNSEYYISGVEAENLGTVNGGNPGDVVLGYFNPLPGLTSKELTEFFGCSYPKGFMVVNGLFDGMKKAAQSGNNGKNWIQVDDGSEEETMQHITLTFAKNHPQLNKINKETGKIEAVEIGADNTLDITMGGGAAELYFWSDVSADASSNPEQAEAAFDQDISTSWAAAGDASYPVTLEKKFSGSYRIDKVTINEAGNNVTGFGLEYRTGTGNWESIPLADTDTGSIGLSKTVQFAPVKASGIRLVIRSAGKAPAIREIRYFKYDETSDDTAEKTVTINDNDMGEGINQFSYDDSFSYRETEGGNFPSTIGNDVHFTNVTGGESVLHFYGTKLELFYRKYNNNANISVSIDGGDPVTINTSAGGEKFGSTVFADLELKEHTAVIRKTSEAQIAIDGAKVTYKGLIPDSAGRKVMTYINDKSDKIIYNPEAVATTANEEPDKRAAGWAQFTQTDSTNTGWTSSSKEGAYYEIPFYGTDVTVYAPKKLRNIFGGNDTIPWGEAVITLNGEPVQASYDVDNDNGNVNFGLPVLKIHASDENADHKLRITVKSGVSRIDYAVVSAIAEKEPVEATTATVEGIAGEHGKIEPKIQEVKLHDDALLRAVPDEGYMLDQIESTGGHSVDGNTILIPNVQKDHTVSVTFRKIADKTALETALETAEAYIPDGYTEESYAVLKAAIEEAKAVLEDENADQDAIEEQINKLEEAISKLESILADLTQLQSLYNAVSRMDMGIYTEDSAAALKNALVHASEILDKENATKVEAAEAESGLMVALAGLQKKETDPQTDKALAKALYNAYKDLDLSGYTQESAAVFTEALDSLSGVIEKEDATQEEVDNAIASLLSSATALQELPEDPEQPEITADFSLLKVLCDAYTGVDTGKYTKESADAFLAALKGAKEVLNNKEADQAAVDQAAADLAKAAAGLTEKTVITTDTTTLKVLYQVYSGLATGKYTDSSAKDLRDALAVAAEVLNNPNAVQDQIDQAAAGLMSAAASLEVKPEEAPKPVTPALKKGQILTYKGLKYKVTNPTAGKAAVMVAGASSRSVKKVTVPSSVTLRGVKCKVTKIGPKSFKNYKNLEKVILGANVTAIGKQAFYGDSKLTSIKVKSKVLEKAYSNCLKKISPRAVIRVPGTKVNEYKKIFKNRGQKSSVRIK
ncbi:discoidin domain-containing protein [uncultured Robinsoniella sp.]|uniref:discoidin domain-containing protein n=1 Tax=uncultured Robinsoniella sp. TaxID=904190 RepID=UPI00374FC4C7